MGGVKLIAIVSGVPTQLNPIATSNAEGLFQFENLAPGPRVIRIGPTEADLTIAQTFTREDAASIGQDLEVAYWPGGVSTEAQALPLEVRPGVTTEMGPIRVRKTSYYKVRLINREACAPEEIWSFRATDFRPDSGARNLSVPCRPELLLQGLAPGQRLLRVSSSRRGTSWWASVPLHIRDENVEIPVTFQPSVDIPVQVLGRDGKPPTNLRGVSVSTRNDLSAIRAPDGKGWDASGRSVLPRVMFPAQNVGVAVPPNLAVHEIRYNHLPLTSFSFTLSPGSPLEVIVDDQPASLDITLPDGVTGVVLIAVRMPADLSVAEQPAAPFVLRGPGLNGRGSILSLTEGEYRVAAFPVNNTVDLPPVIRAVATSGERVTLKRGEKKAIKLNVSR